MRLFQILVVAFGLSGLFTFPADGAENAVLARLTFSSGWDALPAIVGIERGFFAEEGIVVSGLAVSSPVAAIESLAVGTTDFALVPQRVMLVMVAAKAPVKVVALSGWGTEMELLAAPDAKIKAVADLKGKTVAILQGSEALPVLIRLLNQAKLKPTDLKIANMSAEALLKALPDKKADAVFETRHFTDPIVQKKQGVVVVAPAVVTKTIGSIDGIPLVARAETIAKEPAMVQRFLNAWVKSLKYIQQDQVDASRILQIFFHRQGVSVTTPIAQEWVKMTRYDQYDWSKAAVADAEYNGWALNVGGVLKVAPKLDGYIDNSFVDKAAKALQ